jgi:3',5'-cyclic-AMP phosphodiesterase
MTRFLHLSDLHLSPANAPRKAELLARVAAAVERLPARPEFAIVSGDLTDRGDADSYGMLQEMLAGFPVPVHLALGNHDSRRGFHAAYGTGEGAYHHATVAGALHLITLDTAIPGRVHGAIGPDQIAWLEAELPRHPDLPKLVVLHHPPRLDPLSLPWSTLDEASTAALGAAIAGHRIAGLLSGHVHMNRMALWQGAPLVVSSGLHSTIDPLHEDGLRILEGAGFNLCRWSPEGLAVTYVPLEPEGRQIGLIDLSRLEATG